MADAGFDNHLSLLDMVDTHAARVTQTHAASFHCRKGCTACCRQDLAVTRVEAAFILGWLVQKGVPPHDPSRTPTDGHGFFDDLAGSVSCTFLTEGGGCGIYPVRPIICRSHGLPIRLPDGRVDTCPLNFTQSIDQDYGDIPEVDLLDLDTLNERVILVELLFCEEEGEETGRFPLSRVRQMAEELLAE